MFSANTGLLCRSAQMQGVSEVKKQHPVSQVKELSPPARTLVRDAALLHRLIFERIKCSGRIIGDVVGCLPCSFFREIAINLQETCKVRIGESFRREIS